MGYIVGCWMFLRQRSLSAIRGRGFLRTGGINPPARGGIVGALFGILGSEFQILDSEFLVPDSWFQIQDSGFWILDSWFQALPRHCDFNDHMDSTRGNVPIYLGF